MSKNESRVERKKESQNLQEKSKLSLNKMYYWIIGFLFLVLFVLVLFIFSRSGDKVNLTDDQDQTEAVQEETEQPDSTNDAEQSESDTAVVEESADDEEETESEEDSEGEEDETLVNEDAPIDESHDVDYNSGSADRVAIKAEIMQVTGLGSDLTEYWVGNNGPGRVTATVANPDQSRIYEVQLQYGEGEWHVTSYQPLDTLPKNFN